jgi:hypothetical protein
MGLGGLALGIAISHSAGPPWIWLVIAAMDVLIVSARLWPLSLGMTDTLRWRSGTILELRLLAVAALSLLFLFVLFLLVFILILCFAYAAAASGRGFVASQIATWAPAVDDRGRVVVTAVALAAFAGLAWAALRISLAAPASVARGRVQVLASWPLTRRRAWTIAVANLANLAGPAILVAGLLSGRRIGVWTTVRDLLAGLTLTGLCLPLTIGCLGYFYGELSAVQSLDSRPTP